MRSTAVAAAILLAAVTACTGAAAARQPIPTPIGAGAAYRPAAGSHGAPGLRCARASRPRFGAHLELFANRRVVLVPAGIGVGRDGGCSYPARTREPTGVVEVAAGAGLTLGHLFAIWGRRVSRSQLLGFRARPGEPLRAFVNGRPWRGDPRSIPLRRHAQIVLEIRGYVPPHASYRFPPGL